MKKLILTSFTAVVFSVAVFAGGFQINEHGAKAMAMAGAFTAVANDASAVYFNPAAMTFLHGTQISAGTTLIGPSASFRGPFPAVDEYVMEKQLFTPINFYVTHRFSEDFAVGLGVNNPYGLGTKWDEKWVGKYLAIDTEIVTFFFNLNVAYKIVDELSIAVGGSYAMGDVTIIRDNPLTPFSSDARVSLKGDASSYQYNAALFWQPIPEISFGVSFRSESKFDFEGDATAEHPPQFAGLVPTGSISATLKTPMNFTIGGAIRPSDNFVFSLDWQWVGWSSYKKLEVIFNDVLDESGNKLVSSADRNYQNTFIYRFGMDWGISDYFNLRGGVLYDNNPVKSKYVDPTLPDADRIGFNIGFGVDIIDHLSLDLAYLYLYFLERQVNNSAISYTDGDAPFNGIYNSNAHLFGVNLSYKF